MAITVISHDAFGRFEVIRERAREGECCWCGQHARLWTYGHRPDDSNRPSWHYGTFCGKGCHDNQWNTVCGKRVFDWNESIYPNKDFKRGYWLEQTADMKTIRATTLTCGYCGKQYPNGKPGFCSACLDSAYLKKEDLHLLRLIPTSASIRSRSKQRPQLTQEEEQQLMPLYVEAQTVGKNSRAVAARQKKKEAIEHKYETEKQAIEEEYRGMMWLWEHNVNLENVIYYSHTQTFCFGWRQPVKDEVFSELLDILCEFIHNYEIKGVNRKVPA